jgi:hypothetical protein
MYFLTLHLYQQPILESFQIQEFYFCLEFPGRKKPILSLNSKLTNFRTMIQKMKDPAVLTELEVLAILHLTRLCRGCPDIPTRLSL